MDAIAITAFSLTLVVKFGLFIYTRSVLKQNPESSSVEALMQDHRNDLYTNFLGFLAALVGAFFYYFVV